MQVLSSSLQFIASFKAKVDTFLWHFLFSYEFLFCSIAICKEGTLHTVLASILFSLVTPFGSYVCKHQSFCIHIVGSARFSPLGLRDECNENLNNCYYTHCYGNRHTARRNFKKIFTNLVFRQHQSLSLQEYCGRLISPYYGIII